MVFPRPAHRARLKCHLKKGLEPRNCFVRRLTTSRARERELILRCTQEEREINGRWNARPEKKERKNNGQWNAVAEKKERERHMYKKRQKKRKERSQISFHFNVVLLFAYPVPTARTSHQKYFCTHHYKKISRGIVPKLLNYKHFYLWLKDYFTSYTCLYLFIFGW